MKKIVKLSTLSFLVLTLTSCNLFGTSSSVPNLGSSESSGSSGLGDDTQSSHVHTFSSSWSYDDKNHWHEATCGHDEKSGVEPHSFTSIVTDPTYENGGYTTYTCSTCGYSYRGAETSKLEHNYSADWSYDEDSHWHACTDAGYDFLKKDEADHHFVADITDPTYESGGYTTYTCSTCGYSYTGNETTALSITITWVNYDGTILEIDNNVRYGSVPSYDGQIPTKEDDLDYDYTFIGWSPKISEAVCSVTYTAQYDALTSKGLKFSLNASETEYSVLSYSGVETEVHIPAIYNTLPVTAIGEYAFSECSSLEVVSLPDSIVSIGSRAFRNCALLAYIYIPNSVTFVGARAFLGCDALKIYCQTSSTPFGWDESWNYSNRPAYFDVDGISAEGFAYSVYVDDLGGNYLAIRGYIGNESRIEIPSSLSVNGEYVNVSRICASAFEECAFLESVFIPNCIVFAENEVFEGCENVIVYCEAVVKPDGWNDRWSVSAKQVIWGSVGTSGVTDDGFRFALSKGENEDTYATIIGYEGSASEISLPTTINYDENFVNVIAIADRAFKECSVLRSVYIPACVANIGSYAFKDCINLEKVLFADNSNLTIINSGVFQDCISLSSIVIPDSVTGIGAYAFSNCISLSSIDIPNSVVSIGYRAFSMQSDDTMGFIGYSKLSSITFAESGKLTSIGDFAFRNCVALTELFIPDSVTTIGSSFYRCSGIVNVTFGKNSKLAELGASAFAYCESLVSIILPDGLTTIGRSSFGNCVSLLYVSIPKSVTTIDLFAFSSCSSDLKIYCGAPAEPSGYASNWESGATVYWSSYISDEGLAYTVINDGESNEITIIDYFGESTELIIPSSIILDGAEILVTAIGQSAFENCASLSSVFIPSSVISVYSNAFSGCSSNLTVYFENYEKLSNWESNFSHYGSVVWGYAGLRGTTEDGLKYAVSQDENEDYFITIVGYEGLSTEVVIPSKIEVNGNSIPVRSIAGFAFESCKVEISSIYISNGVSNIGQGAFRSLATTLLWVYIPKSVSYVGQTAFYKSFYDERDFKIYCQLSSKPDEWDLDWNYGDEPVFWNIDGISDDGFAYTICEDEKGLQYISIEDYLGGASILNIPATINDSGSNYPVKMIGDSAFSSVNSISSVIIPDSVISIGDYAFSSCASLVSVEIPDSVTSIGDFAFSGCPLDSVRIPSSVETVGVSAFNLSGCIIYCDAAEKPDGWNEDWTTYNYPVVWGYTGLSGVTEDGFSYKICVDADGNSYATIIDCSNESAEITIPRFVSMNGENIPVTSINARAFKFHHQLVTVNIPDTVTHIGAYAFSDCDSLEYVFLPDSIDSVGYNAFADCDDLTVFCEANSEPDGWDESWNPTNRPTRWGVDGISDEGFAYTLCTDDLGGQSVSIRGTTWDAEDLFVPDYLTVSGTQFPVSEIGNFAFEASLDLTSVHISSRVTTIGDSAFKDCVNLVSLTFGEDSELAFIGAQAFYGCSSLSSPVFISIRVVRIGLRAFEGCGNATFYCEAESRPKNWASNWYYGSSITWGVNGITNEGYVYAIMTDEDDSEYLKIVEYIGDESILFIPSSIYVGERYISVGAIGKNAFKDLANLNVVYIPSSVLYVEKAAFDNCDNLVVYCQALYHSNWESYWVDPYTLVYSGIDGITDDGFFYSFYSGNAGEEYISIRGYIGGETDLIISAQMSINGKLYTVGKIDDDAFRNHESLISVIIPNTVVSIGDSAFLNCVNLSALEFNDGSILVSVDRYAFYGCESLLSISFPNTLVSIGDYAVARCSRLSTVSFGENSQLTSIGEFFLVIFFVLSDVYLPATVVSVGRRAFYSYKVYCEASSQPEGWDSEWYYRCTVLWGVDYEEYLELIK